MLVSDEVTMLEWTVRGTHDGGFDGIPATDRDVETRAVSNRVTGDGRTHEGRGHYDTRSLLSQPGDIEENSPTRSFRELG